MELAACRLVGPEEPGLEPGQGGLQPGRVVLAVAAAGGPGVVLGLRLAGKQVGDQHRARGHSLRLLGVVVVIVLAAVLWRQDRSWLMS
jgi:hypothetical protein